MPIPKFLLSPVVLFGRLNLQFFDDVPDDLYRVCCSEFDDKFPIVMSEPELHRCCMIISAKLAELIACGRLVQLDGRWELQK